jgi:hypothetical protein
MDGERMSEYLKSLERYYSRMTKKELVEELLYLAEVYMKEGEE